MSTHQCQSPLSDFSLTGPFTVFAPTDEAFVKLPDWVKKAVSNKTILAEVLQYHVLYGAVKSTDLKNDLLEKSALGQPIRVNIYDEPAGRKVVSPGVQV